MKIVVDPFKWDIKRVYKLSQAVWNRYKTNGFVISLTYTLTFINFTRKHRKNIFVGKRKRNKKSNLNTYEIYREKLIQHKIQDI